MTLYRKPSPWDRLSQFLISAFHSLDPARCQFFNISFSLPRSSALASEYHFSSLWAAVCTSSGGEQHISLPEQNSVENRALYHDSLSQLFLKQRFLSHSLPSHWELTSGILQVSIMFMQDPGIPNEASFSDQVTHSQQDEWRITGDLE